MSDSTIDKTANALKYLPISVTVEYFLSLPEKVINNMYSWFLGNNIDYKGNRTNEQKAYYLYACFSSTDQATDSDDVFYMYNQLKFYILNHE